MKRRLSPSASSFCSRSAACGSQSKADACKKSTTPRDKALKSKWTLSRSLGSEDFKNN